MSKWKSMFSADSRNNQNDVFDSLPNSRSNVRLESLAHPSPPPKHILDDSKNDSRLEESRLDQSRLNDSRLEDSYSDLTSFQYVMQDIEVEEK